MLSSEASLIVPYRVDILLHQSISWLSSTHLFTTSYITLSYGTYHCCKGKSKDIYGNAK